MPGAKPVLPKPKLTDHPVDVGLRTEAAIVSQLIRKGYDVLVPLGVNQRYDLVLEINGRFVRAQCKTGRFRAGVVRFSPRSTRCNRHSIQTRGYRGEVDIFLVYCRELDRTYAVPVEEAPSSEMWLRVEPALNGQRLGTHPAARYELPE